ncbi:MAG: GNAT family N-acetyltransferase [Solirubrobacterales bacterium]|nr:GNAT family N-acetyltransferase [Solirubrobacterales bacterium]
MIGSGEAVTADLLCLRPGAKVADDYESLFTDPAVERWLRPEPMAPFSRHDMERMARRDQAHWDQHGFGPWSVREREGGAFVGRGGLAWAAVNGKLEVELPWAVMPSSQNRGYATEMAIAAIRTAREFGVERVVSLTLPANRASRRVMDKAGLRYVGEIEHVGLPHVLYELNL